MCGRFSLSNKNDVKSKFDIDIKELRQIVDELKETQKQHLQENLGALEQLD